MREYLYPEQRKSIWREILLAILVVIVLAGVAVLLGQVGKGDPDSYWNPNNQVEYTGYNTFGQAEEENFFNYEKFYDNFIGGDGNFDPDWYEDLTNCIDIDLSKDYDLRNGEKLVATAEIDFDELNEKFPQTKHKLSGERKYSKTFKVQGLQEVQVIDPMDYVENVYLSKDDDRLHYNIRTDSIGNYYLRRNDDYDDEIDLGQNGWIVDSGFIDYDSSDNYPKLGEKVTISAGNNSQSDAEAYGIMVKESQKVFTVLSEEDVNP